MLPDEISYFQINYHLFLTASVSTVPRFPNLSYWQVHDLYSSLYLSVLFEDEYNTPIIYLYFQSELHNAKAIPSSIVCPISYVWWGSIAYVESPRTIKCLPHDREVYAPKVFYFIVVSPRIFSMLFYYAEPVDPVLLARLLNRQVDINCPTVFTFWFWY